MARPVKKGLDFFPLDVTVDDNLELLEAECGLEGFAIIIKLWQKIYATGYFIDWEEDNALLFARKINSDLTTVNKVVNVGLNRGLFNKNLFNSYKILSSKGIQSRYSKICSDANRKDYSILDEYNLINSELTRVNTEEIEVKSESSTQSKVNKNKVDYSNLNKEEYPTNRLSIDYTKTMDRGSQQEQKEEKEKEQEQKNVSVYNYWNSKNIYKHNSLTKSIGKALDKLPLKNQDDVKQAIDRYEKAYNDKSYFYNHCWTLDKFITQSNGYKEWLEEGSLWVAYTQKTGKGLKPKEKKVFEVVHVGV